MTPRTLKRGGLRIGLMVAICMVLGAWAAASSAMAATQHWASATPPTEVSPGSEQSFTAKNRTSVDMKWRFSGINISMSCNQLSSSGKASNPMTEAAGELHSTSFELSGCSISMTNCAIKGGTIPFQTLSGYARTEAGQRRLVLKPEVGTAIAFINLQGAGGTCALPPSVEVSGYLEATQNPSQPGLYEVNEPSHLNIGAAELKLTAAFSLSTPSGQSLVLSSKGTGEPRWYFGGGEWSPIKAGESIGYWQSDFVPLTLNTKVSGTKVQISECEGIFAGHLENPVGGGAGKASVGYTPGYPGACSINVPQCAVGSSFTNELSGVATEVGGVPAIEWTPKSGSTVLLFQIENSGAKTCPLIGTPTLKVTGKLITTSLGDGRFSFAASELMVGTQPATISGEFGLETTFGKSLRLQP